MLLLGLIYVNSAAVQVMNINMRVPYIFINSIFQTSFAMELFQGNEIDRRVMERVGCLNYSHSNWESEKPDVYQRQLYYKFDRRISSYRGEVTSTQQKSRLPGREGWLIEEIMTLHGVPLGDYFTVWHCMKKLVLILICLNNARQKSDLKLNVVGICTTVLSRE